MAEWLKAVDSKSIISHKTGIGGSNPPLSSIGIAPGHKNTIVFFAENGVVQKLSLFTNADFVKVIPNLLDEHRFCNYITLFTGPAPLMTARGICAWVKGWHEASKNPVVIVEGPLFYSFPFFDATIINLFSQRYVIVNNHTHEEIIGNDECLKQFIINHEDYFFGCSFGVKDYFFAGLDNKYSYILHAHYEKIAEAGYKKYLNNEFSFTHGIIPLIM